MNLPKLEGYVIYNPATGMYSKGGTYGIWAKKPKIWSDAAHVKAHLAMYVNRDYTYLSNGKDFKCRMKISTHYKDCVVLNLVDNTEPFKIYDYMREKAEKEANRYGYEVFDEWNQP